MSEPRIRHVSTAAGASYPHVVGSGLLERVSDLITLPATAEAIVLVSDANVAALHRERALEGLSATGLRIEEVTLEPGEGAKSAATLEMLWRCMAFSDVHRGDVVAALGGGVVGDVAGFAAATYHRGIAFLQMPTSLLAQVDASIGGKTAIDLPEGKNLVGAFHQPIGVLADIDTLQTLPDAAFSTGMAEVIKHAFLAPDPLLDRLHVAHGAILSREVDALCELVVEAAAVKIGVVERDEREASARAFLNYGHTLGHAIEAVEAYAGRSHGEAVAIGMVFAAELASRLGHVDTRDAHRELLSSYGLPIGGIAAPWEDLVTAMMRDKKYESGMRFVVLEDLGAPVLARVDEALCRDAFEAVR